MTATFFMSRFQMYLLFRIHLCSTSFQLTDFVFETFSLLSLSHLYYQIISCLSGCNTFKTFPPKKLFSKVFVDQTIYNHTDGSIRCHHQFAKVIKLNHPTGSTHSSYTITRDDGFYIYHLIKIQQNSKKIAQNKNNNDSN